jgi:type IV secretory pathway VirB3-like protein
MTDTRQYARPVRRSLLRRDLVGGIPQIGALLLFFAAVIFIVGLEMYFMAVPLAVFYIIMRALTKKDQWMIDIVAENIGQKDVYIP